MGIYPNMLGDRWLELPASVRRFHYIDHPISAKGVFRIRRGSHFLAGIVCGLFGLPKNCDSAETRLSITMDDGCEQWLRTFDSRPFLTLQSPCCDGLLLERIGRVELTFRLSIEDRALVYTQVKAAFRIGPIRMPFPKWFAPNTWAKEAAEHNSDQAHIIVKVSAPVIGTLIFYEGTLALQESN